MSPENFAYWLQGFVELTQGQTPNPAQWKSIQEHLGLVFKKVTPKVAETVSVKVDVDTKDAQKSVDDLKKAYEELARQTKELNPMPTWWNPTQPTWSPPSGWPPGVTIC
jgi:ABC-type sugar transport system substrate-binding protein